MDTRKLEKFAQSARRQLHEEVAARLERVLSTDSGELRAKAATIQTLKDEIAATSRDAVVERVAYTWFNRFIALRYMDVNRYTRMGTVSPAGEGFTQPEILQEAKRGYIDEEFAPYVDQDEVFGLLNGQRPSADPQQEAYRLLLVAVCNAYHQPMPFMFEEIDHYTELLVPDDLLSEGSILQAVREALTPEACQDVEVIGWLYQYYISEKKDVVMGRRGKVPPEDIPAVTQLFTPHWIVRYMVENSLGRLWMLNHPDSGLVQRMDYYIAPKEERGSETSDQWSVTGDQDTEDKPTDHYPLSTDHRSLPTDHYPLITSPEELRLCDPACGSGHILTYAFDLLYAIYEEQGYNPVDIPRLILEKNLTGIEIDPRAGALAGFALMMKARRRDRRFLRREVQPDIVVMEDIAFTPQELNAYMDAVGRDLFTQDVRDWLTQFEQATTFGSLIRPLVTDTKAIRKRLEGAGVFEDLFLSRTHDRVRAVLRMTEALTSRYHVVVANPPYMGSRGMAQTLKDFAKEHYPDSKSDLFAMFMERGFELVCQSGYNAMVTMQSWMFLSSYEALRTKLLQNVTIECMVHMANMVMGIAFGTAATVWCKRRDPGRLGSYSYVAHEDLTDENQPFEFPVRNERLATASAVDFQKIPGAPIAYWVSARVRDVFASASPLGALADVKHGLSTGRNAEVVRYWFEVSDSDIGFGYSSAEDAHRTNHKWYPYNKGGSFRKWYGNQEFVLRYDLYGIDLMATFPGHRHDGKSHYFRSGVTWTFISSSNFAARYTPEGFVFDVAGSSLFSPMAKPLLAFLCSKLASDFLKILNPTLNFQVGNLRSLPILVDELDERRERIELVAEQAICHEASDWDGQETSWNFEVLPIFGVSIPTDLRSDTAAGSDDTDRTVKLSIYSLVAAYVQLRRMWLDRTVKMRELEEKNNGVLTEAYGLSKTLPSEVVLSEITLTCNPHYRYGNTRLKKRNWASLCNQFPETCQQLASISIEMAPDMPEEDRLGLEQRLLDDTMQEFISYAVGCMFGRYSLDKPGLILANQGETVEDYVRKVASGQWSVVSREEAKERIAFMPDEDNVIPILDGEWFADDITERFKAFLRVTFGDAHYAENLAFIEAAIGRDIRSYFVRDFYDDHVKTYQKRPIYWLFSSPEGSFNALIYMHRYQPDTASIVLNDYLRELRTKLAARRDHLTQVSVSASASQRDKTQAQKEMEKIAATLRELQAYEDDVLYPLAAQRIEIDLGDGVLVNYNKFGKALKHVRGLSGRA